ncbi:MAG TPA: hypothetical protein VI389_00785 [Geobacteraceae bacterium]
MFHDTFDRVLWLLLAIFLGVLVFLVLRGAPAGSAASPAVSRGVEREIAAQARVAFLQKVYEPVEELRRSGNQAGALLKLDELAHRYPGEAHGHILQGEILRVMGSAGEAAANFVAGVKLNGEYIDRTSPLSRRGEIEAFVAENLPAFAERARSNPGDRSIQAALQNVHYLQSRLAGGCE